MPQVIVDHWAAFCLGGIFGAAFTIFVLCLCFSYCLNQAAQMEDDYYGD